MFKKREPETNKIIPGIIVARLCLALVLLSMTACQSAPKTESAPSNPSPASFALTPEKSQPISGGPVLLYKGISLRKALDIGPGKIRLVLNPADGNVYVLNPGDGVYKINNLADNASKEQVASSQQDIGGAPTGMAFAPDGTLYVVYDEVVNNTKNRVVVRKGVPDGNGKFTWGTLAASESYPLSNTYFDHLYNGIVVSPDGQYVYINGGSRTDHGELETNGGAFPGTREVALTSKILRIPTSAHDLVLPNDESALNAQKLIFSRGTRNAYDMAFAPNGDLFAIDNGPDADYPDELNWIQAGAHYGFPWRFGTQDNPQRLADYDPTKDKHLQSGFFAVDHGFYHNDPKFPQPPGTFTDPVVNLGPDAMKYRGDDGKEYDAGKEGKTLSTFTPHRSPLGLVFATDAKLPAPWRGSDSQFNAFLLSYGAAAGTLSDQGQDLLFLQLVKKGDHYETTTHQIATGFKNPIDAVLIDNKLYVLEYGGSAIWELTFQ